MITVALQSRWTAHASGAWARRFARTTPGLVVVIAVSVAALCIVAGAGPP